MSGFEGVNVRYILLGAIVLVGIMILSIWPTAMAKPPPAPTKTVVVTQTKTITPPACEQLTTDTDAFINVTDDFLSAGNAALDALLAFDDEALHQEVKKMRRLEDRYGAVMDRYQDSRAGCL
jgi:hypothetical protein